MARSARSNYFYEVRIKNKKDAVRTSLIQEATDTEQRSNDIAVSDRRSVQA